MTAEVNGSKRKNVLGLNWDLLLPDSPDDPPLELLITSSEKSKRGGKAEEKDIDYRRILDQLKSTHRKHEAERQRRNKIRQQKDGFKREETIQLSDQSDDGASCRKDRSMDEDEQTVHAFGKELSFFNHCQGRKMSQNGRLSSSGRSNQQSSSRSTSFQSPIALAENRNHKFSNSDKNVNRFATSSVECFYTNRISAPQDQPSTKLKPKLPSSYNLVDEEDIEDSNVTDTSLHAETLSDWDDGDPLEVLYTDMECLAPAEYLSSTIMNFYIRYLQQSSSEYRTGNYHFFNTYFYSKLKLNYTEDSFPKFRKRWKGVNIFEKAYILLPIYQGLHWSLVIICHPAKEDELGPIILHLDSLAMHNSSEIFDKIRRFLKEEWSYLRNSEVPLDLPITDEIWENLDHRIIDRKMQVPQHKNGYDCGLFVLHFMERFIREAPKRLRLTEKDTSMICQMFGRQWFDPKEASNLRVRIHNLLVHEFKNAKDKEAILSLKC